MTDPRIDPHGDDPEQADDAGELLARLGAADPAASLPPATPDTVARLLEDTMSHHPGALGTADPEQNPEHDHERDPEHRHPEAARARGLRSRNRLTWLVGAAALVLIAAVSVTALLNRGQEVTTADPGPTAGAGGSGGAGTEGGGSQVSVTLLTAAPPTDARCAMPTAERLAAQELAFVGTVQSIDDSTVTLAPSRFYRGTSTERVEVTASAGELDALIGAVEFVEGETYLVSATDGRVTVCGFSGPVTPEREQLYDAAFGG